jgi:hypothetical protein
VQSASFSLLILRLAGRMSLCRVSAAEHASLVQRLAESFNDKRKKGLAKLHGSGFGGSGYRFDLHEDDVHNAIKKRHAIEYKQPGDEDAEAPRIPGSGALVPAGGGSDAFDVGRGQYPPEPRIGGAKFSAVEAPPEVANVSEVRLEGLP